MIRDDQIPEPDAPPEDLRKVDPKLHALICRHVDRYATSAYRRYSWSKGSNDRIVVDTDSKSAIK